MQISVQHEHQHWSDTLSGIFRDSKAAECANTLVARPGPTPLQSTEGVGNSFCLSFFFKKIWQKLSIFPLPLPLRHQL